MSLKLGDILFCKKDFYYNDNCCCSIGEKFIVTKTYEENNSVDMCFHLLENVNNSNIIIYFITDEDMKENNTNKYIWNHFKNFSRIKDIAKQFI